MSQLKYIERLKSVQRLVSQDSCSGTKKTKTLQPGQVQVYIHMTCTTTISLLYHVYTHTHIYVIMVTVVVECGWIVSP